MSEQDELPSSVRLDFQARLDDGWMYSGHLEANPSRQKELSKESGSKILPWGDGSCWMTSSESISFKKSLRCWLGSLDRSSWNEHSFFTNGMVSDQRETVTPSPAAENVILINAGVGESAKSTTLGATTIGTGETTIVGGLKSHTLKTGS
nr:hypothetical protein [Tanacetum cinerariifolium]